MLFAPVAQRRGSLLFVRLSLPRLLPSSTLGPPFVVGLVTNDRRKLSRVPLTSRLHAAKMLE